LKRIIVEGVDGSGKSTLIEGLLREFHFLTPVVNEKRGEQDFEKWWPEVLDTHYHGLIPIHDRFYYSELVYGPVLRGTLTGSLELHKSVREQLRAEAFLIYARPSFGSIAEKARVNQQMNGVLTHLPELLDGYDTIMQTQIDYYGHNRFFTYDWRFKSDFNLLLKQLDRYLIGDRQ
jgi:hypothetical protein